LDAQNGIHPLDGEDYPFTDWLKDKIDDWLGQDHVPWIGKGSGGKQIQPGRMGDPGSPGTVSGVQYLVQVLDIDLGGYTVDSYALQLTGPIGGVHLELGSWQRQGQPGEPDADKLTVNGQDIPILGGYGWYHPTIIRGFRPVITRLDGTSEADDRAQDPNKPPPIAPINQEPFGPFDTRGAKPPSPPNNGGWPKDPETKPLPKGESPPGLFPPPIWDGPPIKDPGVPMPDDYNDPTTGKGGKGGTNQDPQPQPSTTPVKPTNTPTGSPGSSPSRPGGGGGSGSGEKPKKVRRKTQFYDPASGITYEVTEYDDGSKVVSAPSGLNRPGITLTPDGIQKAIDNHNGIKQYPDPGITPTQDPRPVNPTTPITKPPKTEEPKAPPITVPSPTTIERPTPTQDPTPIQRPTPPKPDPISQTVPVKTPNPNPTLPDPNPPDDQKTFPPVVELSKTRPPVIDPDPIPSNKGGLTANPVTGNPVSPNPVPEPPTQPPKVGNPGNGGSSCQWPADRQIVIDGERRTQTEIGVVNTLITEKTNKAVEAVGKNVDKAVEAIGTPATGKASTLFNAIDNVQSFTEKFAKATRLDKIYNALTLFLVIHNAAQLSSSLGNSLDELINTGLQAIGIRDEKDEELSISGAIGKSVESFIRSIIGNDVYDGASLAWIKGNAIYSASVNIADAITSPLAGLASGLQTVGNNIGKIGNALVKSGTVLKNSYERMSENVLVSTGKLAQLNNYIQSGDTAVELVDSFTELARVPLETKESFDNAKTELDELKTKMNEEVATKKTEDAAAKNASQSPDITDLDIFKNLL
jgi:hypothetical protein